MDLMSRPAFERLAPVPGPYATLPIAQAFDWMACADAGTAGEWYLVCFRSVRHPAADEALLQELDDRAHLEASSSPGFVHYFKGHTTERGECLSFCLWDSRRMARAAAGRPAHSQASAITGEMYASYRLEFYRVVKRPDRDTFEFSPYDRSRTPSAARPH
jgi:hypothetical protein